jgi:hypothetical protein
MNLRIRNQKDFAAGVIYILTGAGFAIGAQNYKIGEAARMGPGWFPMWVGILLALVGIWTLAGGLKVDASPEKLKMPNFRAMAWILGSVVLFGLLLQPMGLVVSLAALILVSSMASHEFAWLGALANTVILILFSTGVFIYGISMQIQLWPRFLTA